MSLALETADGGEINVGYFGPDTSKVSLGELPTITTQQFAGFAAIRLAEQVIPHIDTAMREQWAGDMHAVATTVAGLALMETRDEFFALGTDALVDEMSRRLDSVEAQEKPWVRWVPGMRHLRGFWMRRIIGQELSTREDTRNAEWAVASAMSPSGVPEFYRENPFVVQADGQRVGFTEPGDGVRYVIGANDFFRFTTYVLRGGMRGWDERGTYPEVIDAVNLLDSTLTQA